MFGDNVINFQKVSLIDKFNGWAYLGWSGFLRGDRGLELRDAYLCEDVNYLEVKTLMATQSNKTKFTDTVTSAPNETILLQFDHYSKGVRVPHLKGEVDDEFNLKISSDCGTVVGPNIQDNFILTAEVLLLLYCLINYLIHLIFIS